ncbi:MAG: hypothetical protein GY858_01035 [Candidatus Omnitrophica bacterium]|nr:hypothetical protein [Candidatus Omnitrophota bacterium]
MTLRSKSIDYYLGNFDRCFCGYTNDQLVREKAASGGMVSQLLLHLLENKHITAAIVSKLEVVNGKLRPQPFIARSRKDILSSGSSIYIDFAMTPITKQIEEITGPLAIVALPCQLKTLANLNKTNKIITIGLFCGHTSNSELIESVLKNKIDLKNLKDFCFRRGHWRGQSQITLKSKETFDFPYFDFGLFQNIFFHMPKKCLYCQDHSAENFDISFGDLWLKKFRKKKFKYSAIISRNKKMSDIISKMSDRNEIYLEPLDPQKIISSQKRPLIYHKFTVQAIGKINNSSQPKDSLAWNDYIAAQLILFNMALAEKKIANLIYKLPKELLFLYMVFVRSFLSF